MSTRPMQEFGAAAFARALPTPARITRLYKVKKPTTAWRAQARSNSRLKRRQGVRGARRSGANLGGIGVHKGTTATERR
jgi:hypothetical protein